MKKLVLLALLAGLFSTTASASVTYCMWPDGTYNITMWNKVGCTYNWQCVDEQPAPDTSDYVYTTGKGNSDSYTMTNPFFPANCTAGNVTVYYYARNLYVFPKTYSYIRPFIITHSSNYLGSVFSATSSYAWYSYTWGINPYTGTTWTQSELNDLNTGMLSYGSTGGGKVAQTHTCVTYYCPY